MDVALISPRKTSFFYLPMGTPLAQQWKPEHTFTENFGASRADFSHIPTFMLSYIYILLLTVFEVNSTPAGGVWVPHTIIKIDLTTGTKTCKQTALTYETTWQAVKAITQAVMYWQKELSFLVIGSDFTRIWIRNTCDFICFNRRIEQEK